MQYGTGFRRQRRCVAEQARHLMYLHPQPLGPTLQIKHIVAQAHCFDHPSVVFCLEPGQLQSCTLVRLPAPPPLPPALRLNLLTPVPGGSQCRKGQQTYARGVRVPRPLAGHGQGHAGGGCHKRCVSRAVGARLGNRGLRRQHRCIAGGWVGVALVRNACGCMTSNTGAVSRGLCANRNAHSTCHAAWSLTSPPTRSLLAAA